MLCGLGLAYAAAGIATALAFALFGAQRVAGASLTPGTRILIVPGAFALWPYILLRWLKAPALR